MAVPEGLPDPSQVSSADAAARLAAAEAANLAWRTNTAPVLAQNVAPAGITQAEQADAAREAAKHAAAFHPEQYYGVNPASLGGMTQEQIASRYGPRMAEHVSSYYYEHPSAAFQAETAKYNAQRQNVITSGETYRQGTMTPTVAAGSGGFTGRAAEYEKNFVPLSKTLDISNTRVSQQGQRGIEYASVSGLANPFNPNSAAGIMWDVARTGGTVGKSVSDVAATPIPETGYKGFNAPSSWVSSDVERSTVPISTLDTSKWFASPSAGMAIPGQDMYFRIGDTGKTQLKENAKMIYTESGAFELLQVVPSNIPGSNFTRIYPWITAGGGDYALQGSAVSGKPLVTIEGKQSKALVYDEYGLNRMWAPNTTEGGVSNRILSGIDAYSKAGRELYGGTVQPVDSRTIQSEFTKGNLIMPGVYSPSIQSYANLVTVAAENAPKGTISSEANLPSFGAIGPAQFASMPPIQKSDLKGTLSPTYVSFIPIESQVPSPFKSASAPATTTSEVSVGSSFGLESVRESTMGQAPWLFEGLAEVGVWAGSIDVTSPTKTSMNIARNIALDIGATKSYSGAIAHTQQHETGFFNRETLIYGEAGSDKLLSTVKGGYGFVSGAEAPVGTTAVAHTHTEPLPFLNLFGMYSPVASAEDLSGASTKRAAGITQESVITKGGVLTYATPSAGEVMGSPETYRSATSMGGVFGASNVTQQEFLEKTGTKYNVTPSYVPLAGSVQTPIPIPFISTSEPAKQTTVEKQVAASTPTYGVTEVGALPSELPRPYVSASTGVIAPTGEISVDIFGNKATLVPAGIPVISDVIKFFQPQQRVTTTMTGETILPEETRLVKTETTPLKEVSSYLGFTQKEIPGGIETTKYYEKTGGSETLSTYEKTGGAQRQFATTVAPIPKSSGLDIFEQKIRDIPGLPSAEKGETIVKGLQKFTMPQWAVAPELAVSTAERVLPSIVGEPVSKETIKTTKEFGLTETIYAMAPGSLKGQYEMFYEHPTMTGLSFVAGGAMKMIAKPVESLYMAGRAGIAERAISQGGVWRAAEQVTGTVVSRAPQALAAMYSVDIAGRATEGFTELSPATAVPKARALVVQEAYPMMLGFEAPSSVAKTVKTAEIGYKSALQEGTAGSRLEYYVKQPVTKPYELAKQDYAAFKQERPDLPLTTTLYRGEAPGVVAGITPKQAPTTGLWFTEDPYYAQMYGSKVYSVEVPSSDLGKYFVKSRPVGKGGLVTSEYILPESLAKLKTRYVGELDIAGGDVYKSATSPISSYVQYKAERAVRSAAMPFQAFAQEAPGKIASAAKTVPESIYGAYFDVKVKAPVVAEGAYAKIKGPYETVRGDYYSYLTEATPAYTPRQKIDVALLEMQKKTGILRPEELSVFDPTTGKLIYSTRGPLYDPTTREWMSSVNIEGSALQPAMRKVGIEPLTTKQIGGKTVEAIDYSSVEIYHTHPRGTTITGKVAGLEIPSYTDLYTASKWKTAQEGIVTPTGVMTYKPSFLPRAEVYTRSQTMAGVAYSMTGSEEAVGKVFAESMSRYGSAGKAGFKYRTTAEIQAGLPREPGLQANIFGYAHSKAYPVYFEARTAATVLPEQVAARVTKGIASARMTAMDVADLPAQWAATARRTPITPEIIRPAYPEYSTTGVYQKTTPAQKAESFMEWVYEPRLAKIIPPSTFGETKPIGGFITTTVGGAGAETAGKPAGKPPAPAPFRKTPYGTGLAKEPSLKSMGVSERATPVGKSTLRGEQVTDFRGKPVSERMKPMERGTYGPQGAQAAGQPRLLMEELPKVEGMTQGRVAPQEMRFVSGAPSLQQAGRTGVVQVTEPSLVFTQERRQQQFAGIMPVVSVTPAAMVSTAVESRTRQGVVQAARQAQITSVIPSFAQTTEARTTQASRQASTRTYARDLITTPTTRTGLVTSITPFQATDIRTTQGTRRTQITETKPYTDTWQKPWVEPVIERGGGGSTWPGGAVGGGGTRKRKAAFMETFMMGLDISLRGRRTKAAKSFTTPKKYKRAATAKKKGGKK